ncbi:hypothetical protein MY1884_002636 [Beauveria asiatica]
MPIKGHFRTRPWNNLWRSNIAGLPSTKDLAPNTIFVAVDTEPWALARFLEEVDGLEDMEGRGKWIASSNYDPSGNIKSAVP